MVIFALTKAGYADLEAEILSKKHAVWVNYGVLTEVEINKLRTAGVNLTTFSNLIDPNDTQAILGSLATIEMHHPSERIWVELQSET